MIKLGEEIGRVGGQTDKVKLEIVLTPLKRYTVNGVGKRQIDFVGNLRAVLFEPTDLELVTDSPSLRRKYLDFVLVQVDREYRRALVSYEKGLRQRNKLLERIRDEGISRGQLHFWDDLLVKNGQIISLKRQEFINFANYQEKDFGAYKIIYDGSEISEERLLKYQNEEVASAQTLVGPHRDDWKIILARVIPTEAKGRVEESRKMEFDEKDSSTSLGMTPKNQLDSSVFGSRGEQRLAILWLKMAELEFMTEKTADLSTDSGFERPILLLDDIFSELDENHRHQILEVVPKQQTIITTTDLEHVGKEFLNQIRVIELSN